MPKSRLPLHTRLRTFYYAYCGVYVYKFPQAFLLVGKKAKAQVKSEKCKIAKQFHKIAKMQKVSSLISSHLISSSESKRLKCKSATQLRKYIMQFCSHPAGQNFTLPFLPLLSSQMATFGWNFRFILATCVANNRNAVGRKKKLNTSEVGA